MATLSVLSEKFEESCAIDLHGPSVAEKVDQLPVHAEIVGRNVQLTRQRFCNGSAASIGDVMIYTKETALEQV